MGLIKTNKSWDSSRKGLLLDILVIGVVAAIPFLFYGQDLIFASYPEVWINPFGQFNQRLYMWNPSQNFGTDIGYSMGDLPLVFFFMFFSRLGLPMFMVGRLWYISLVFLHGMSMYFLVSVVIPKANRLAKLAAALSYMYSLYIMITLHGGPDQLLTSGILPIMLGLYICGMNSQGYLKYVKYAALLGLASFIMGGVAPPFSAINVFVLAAFFVFHLMHDRLKGIKHVIKFNFLAAVFIVLINLYWLVPALNFWGARWTEPIFYEPLTQHQGMTSYLEIFRLLGYWGFYSGYRGVPYFPFSPPYISSPLLIFTTIIAPIVALSVLFIRPKDKYVLFFGFLVILSIPMAVGAYPPENPFPLGKLYLWAYNNVPYFNVFRFSYKFVVPLSLAYSAMTGFFVNTVLNRGSKGRAENS